MRRRGEQRAQVKDFYKKFKNSTVTRLFLNVSQESY